MGQTNKTAAVGVGECACDGQAEPGAAALAIAAGVESYQPLENALVIGLSYAGTGVGDGELRVSTRQFRRL